MFDHDVFQIVSFDQRGCGDSVPSAADPATDMAHNTTEHLLADMEALREHLGVQRWLLYGGSWASTLILAYAQRHPERVNGIILVGVTMTRPQEIDWLYHGLRLFLPDRVVALPRGGARSWNATATSSKAIGSSWNDHPDVQRCASKPHETGAPGKTP